MKNKAALRSIEIKNLVLDKNNPRFAELYSGSDKEEDLIEYLLYNESADDIAVAISEAQEFYPDRPLWALKDGNNYLVKDGNRRCAAVKALKHPNKYKLNLSKMEFDELPVLVYNNPADLIIRIRQEHTGDLFKPWGRIAKALEVYRLFSSGTSLESMTELDSSPSDLIKLATFYYEAVKIGGEDFKKLLRSGRGKSGGKTIIFERLFKFRNECGYTFKNKTTNEILINNKQLFYSYIQAMVEYLKQNPDTSSRDIDTEKKNFLNNLKTFGFPPEELNDSNTNKNDSHSKNEKESSSDTSTNKYSDTNNGENHSGKEKDKRKSIKNRPDYKRKKIPSALENLIKECYDLDQNNFANAKMALTRVAFECTLKYVIENTSKKNGNKFVNSNQFRPAMYNNQGNKLKYTNFDVMKNKFTELIKETSFRKAFEDFDLERPHQIIHNYMVGAVPADSKSVCDNLIHLLEFMLQEEEDLINSLDISRL